MADLLPSGKCHEASERKPDRSGRENRALDLRKAGASYAAIAQQLGISEAGAFKSVKRALEKLQTTLHEDIRRIRQLELERLDSLFLAVYPPAKRGDLGAVVCTLKIIHQRSRLLGLDGVGPHILTREIQENAKKFIVRIVSKYMNRCGASQGLIDELAEEMKGFAKVMMPDG